MKPHLLVIRKNAGSISVNKNSITLTNYSNDSYKLFNPNRTDNLKLIKKKGYWSIYNNWIAGCVIDFMPYGNFKESKRLLMSHLKNRSIKKRLFK